MKRNGQTNDLSYAQISGWVASSLDARGAYLIARGFHREAIETTRRIGQADSSGMADLLQFAGEGAAKSGRDEEAVGWLGEAVTVRDHLEEPPGKKLANSLWRLALAHVSMEQYVAGSTCFERAASMVSKSWGPSSREFIRFTHAAADCHLRAHKPQLALALLDEVSSAAVDQDDRDVFAVIRSHALAGTGKSAEAIQTLVEVETRCGQRLPSGDPRMDFIARDLAGLRDNSALAEPVMAWIRKPNHVIVSLDSDRPGLTVIVTSSSDYQIKESDKSVAQAKWEPFPALVFAPCAADFAAKTSVRLSADGLTAGDSITWTACDNQNIRYAEMSAPGGTSPTTQTATMCGDRITDWQLANGKPRLTWHVDVAFPSGSIGCLETYQLQAVNTVGVWRTLTYPVKPILVYPRYPDSDAVLP